jgi:hypothetical protein
LAIHIGSSDGVTYADDDLYPLLNVVMAANQKIIIPESTSGAGQISIGFGNCVYTDATRDHTNAYISDATGNKVAEFSFPVPYKENGATVVIDHIYVTYYIKDANGAIDGFYLKTLSKTGTASNAVSKTTGLTVTGAVTRVDMLASDYTMLDGNAYYLYLDSGNISLGSETRCYKFDVLYHTE